METFIFILLIILGILSSIVRAYRYRNFIYGDLGWRRVGFNTNKYVSKSRRRINRKKALSIAKPFLKPYKDIMGEHSLANENCKVNLIIEKSGAKKIICISKIITEDNKRRIMTATINELIKDYYSYPEDYVIDNMWDILCTNFSYTTMYENILEAAKSMQLNIQESSITAAPQGTKTQQTYDKVSNTNIRTNNLLNINSATEAELLALPGVNIVIAKKAIKYIEKTGGFKSVDEFIQKMKIKDVFEQQIKNITCTSIENDSPQINHEQDQQDNNLDIIDNMNTQNERIIDL